MFADYSSFSTLLAIMTVLAVIVFIALHFVGAGYGMMYNKRWGPAIDNRLGWILMEAPVFIAMAALWIYSPRKTDTVPFLMATFFELHYFQRSFIFPMLIRSSGKMPLSIIAMGVTFNLINALMQGGWIFYLSPENAYQLSWLTSWQFILGTIVFIIGIIINIQSDSIIRNLRKPGDRNHYIPRGGMFKYVACANYFGEVLEWTGFAILTWSWAGAVFAIWTFANLAPRARKIHNRYSEEFGEEFSKLNLRYIIPFVY